MYIDMDSYYTELGGAKNKIFRRNIYYPCDELLPDKIEDFCRSYQYTDVFQCLYKYSALEEDALLYAPFYLDLDADITSDKKFKKMRPYVIRAYIALNHMGLKEKDIQIYFSGSKGFHITVDPCILGIAPIKDLNALYKALALYLYHVYNIPVIDLRIYDKRRLFRIPNTINSKTGLYKVPISFNFLYDCTYDKLLEYAKEPKSLPEYNSSINKNAAIIFYKMVQRYRKGKPTKRQETNYQIPEVKQDLLPCIKTILEEGAIQGARNNTLIVLASGLLQSGYQLEEIETTAMQWNQLNEPPLSETEVLNTIHSAYTMLQNGRRYGCASIRELGLCSSNECRLGELNGNRNN